jgi:heme O synthase-like polyprenyltransferase
MKTMEQIDLNKRYQTMLTLWFALLMSVGIYFGVLLVAAPPLNTEPRTQAQSILILVLTMLGAIMVALSFLVKNRFLERSIDQQNVVLVQQGVIVACAMCEVSALLGLLQRLVIGYRGYLLFLFAAAGMLLHFPRRRHLEAASFKSGNRPY